jgi:3-isopropylmalate dehydratase small subunit
MPDAILERDHPRIISAKFGWDWLSSFRGEDFYKNFIPLFLFLAWRPSWLQILITVHNFGRGSSKDHSTKFGCNWASGFWGEDFYVNFS